MLTTILHFDSINGIQLYDPILNAYHPYNAVMGLMKPLYGVKKISLLGAEIPLAIDNIRNAVVYFTFSYSSWINTQIKITIPDYTYTNVNSLVLQLNNTFAQALSSYTGLSVVWSPFVDGNGFTCVKITSNATSFGFYKPSIFQSKILGFNTNAGTGVMTATNPVNLATDSYLNLYIYNLGVCSNASGIPATFKIPITVGFNDIQYFNTGSNFDQTLEILDEKCILERLHCIMLDRWGIPILGKIDYSFSLKIEHEE